jgi:hypothetical protein
MSSMLPTASLLSVVSLSSASLPSSAAPRNLRWTLPWALPLPPLTTMPLALSSHHPQTRTKKHTLVWQWRLKARALAHLRTVLAVTKIMEKAVNVNVEPGWYYHFLQKMVVPEKFGDGTD